jgi:hypothetical protein
MAATKSTSRSSAKRRPAVKSPAALNRLENSLGTAQDALKALRKDVGRDTSAGARDLYKGLQKFVGDARRDSGKLGTALQRDLEKAQTKLAASSKGPSRNSARKTTSRPRARASSKRS